MGADHSVTLRTQPEASTVVLKINGQQFTVPNDLQADTSLNEFIREYAHLKGTKFMCLEGGCGACIVSVQSKHPTTCEVHSYAVNSCLTPIYSCHGWSITTVEGLGSKANGYHKIQQRLAAANGTQCGYCTAGMVMNMHSILEANPKLTMKEVENSFGGNICRCTGYRPILDAFKSLASDAPPALKQKMVDIEDLMCLKTRNKCSGGSCDKSCGQLCDWEELKELPSPNTSVHVALKDGTNWYRPSSTKEIFEIFDQIGDKPYRLVAGNTGPGVYRDISENKSDVIIDVNGIAEMHGSSVQDDGVTLGANINLTEAMNLFYNLSKSHASKFAYLKTIADHIDLIANVPVRNTGTIGGNLSMKHLHEEFPSDIFLTFVMANAKVLIGDKTGVQEEMEILQYLNTNMNQKIIVQIKLPTYDDSSYVTRSFKIMPRAQNAHAYVNAAFLVHVDKKDDFKVLDKPNILFGGIQPNFIHASQTEDYLVGKKLVNPTTLKEAIGILQKELVPDYVLPDATPEYRRGLAESLFYKFILSLDPTKVNDKNKSGGPILDRPVSTAKQDFDTDRNVWPLNKPIPKLEALIQCSGEAEYSNDIPALPGQLWAQIVLTDRVGVVSKLDFTEASKVPGFWGYYTAKDIPGSNTFYGSDLEKVFVEEGKLADYAGQAVCVVLANSHANAIQASKKVKVEYKDVRKPMIDARNIIKNGPKERIVLKDKISPTKKKTNVKFKVNGKWDIPGQYHFTMETQTCVAVPTEDQLDVYPSSQGLGDTLQSIQKALNLPANQINMRVRRVGGGYGSKLSRNNHSAVVASLAAYLSKKPVRFVLYLENNMQWAGKRFPVLADYEAGVDDDGEIQYLNASVYQENGYTTSDSALGFLATLMHLKSYYDVTCWDVKGYELKTDLSANTWCRAPGSVEAICLIETIMDHIAAITGKDPIHVRLANVDKTGPGAINMPTLINDVVASSDYNNRLKEVEKFNKENRWKKRGISIGTMDYPFDYYGAFHGVVSIFGTDGTVSIAHGAVEMGQGVNTKVAQVAAYILGIDVDIISVKPTTTMMSPNDASTGGSVGSESVAYAVKMCCDQLNERLAPAKKKLGPNAKWVDIIMEANSNKVDLMATYQFQADRDKVSGYHIFGVAVSEVEVDILTGQYQLRRVDLIEDAGESLSPEVDIGQVEGSFVMGMGYFTCELLVYDPDTGKNLTDRTWTYKPPGAKDIPIDFRVTLRKKSSNPLGVLRSKATGEPPLCLSTTVPMAIRNALLAARMDSGLTDKWLEMNAPFTAENIWLHGNTKPEQMVL